MPNSELEASYEEMLEWKWKSFMGDPGLQHSWLEDEGNDPLLIVTPVIATPFDPRKSMERLEKPPILKFMALYKNATAHDKQRLYELSLAYRESKREEYQANQKRHEALKAQERTRAPHARNDLAPQVKPRLGLALSGGGFRASLFHLGVLRRLAELDLLRHVNVLSTVSGGSVLGALYYLRLKAAMEAPGRVDYIRLIEEVGYGLDT